MEPLNREKMIEALEDLADRLERRRVQGSIYLVDGAAIALAYSEERSSDDIDARIESGHETVQKAILEIARERGWHDSWLNEQAAYYIPVGREAAAPLVFYRPGLSVRAASPERILAMKVMSARPKDIDDIVALLPLTDIRTLEALLDLAGRTFPDESLPARSREAAEDAMNRAGRL